MENRIRKGVSEAEHVRLANLENVSYCPLCGSTETEGDGGSSVEAQAADNGMYCLGCGATWTDDYTLAGYRYLLDEGGNETERADNPPDGFGPGIVSSPENQAKQRAMNLHVSAQAALEWYDRADARLEARDEIEAEIGLFPHADLGKALVDAKVRTDFHATAQALLSCLVDVAAAGTVAPHIHAIMNGAKALLDGEEPEPPEAHPGWPTRLLNTTPRQCGWCGDVRADPCNEPENHFRGDAVSNCARPGGVPRKAIIPDHRPPVPCAECSGTGEDHAGGACWKCSGTGALCGTCLGIGGGLPETLRCRDCSGLPVKKAVSP